MKYYFYFSLALFCSTHIFSQWNQEYFMSNDDYLYCVNFVDESNGWISGGDNSKGYLFKTDDGGKNWIKTIFPDSYELESVCFINQNIGWAVGDSGIVVKTLDGGETWALQESGTLAYLSKVFFIDENNGWICYGFEIGESPFSVEHFGTILHTNDGGQNWETQLEVSNSTFRSIYFIDNSIGWAAGYNFGNKTEIYLTVDGGSTWVPKAVDTIWRFFYSIQFTDNLVGWLVGESGIIIKTIDGGNTWFEQTNGFKGYNLKSCCAVDSNNIYAVGQYGTILYTSDGGENWIEQDSGIEKSLNSIFFTNDMVGWAVGVGTCLSTNNGGVTFIKEEIIDTPSKYLLAQNYPNPFNPTTRIEFSIPSESNVEVKVFNTLGMEVATLLNEHKQAGTHSVEFNATNLSSGIYFYKIVSGNYTDIKKMILLR